MMRWSPMNWSFNDGSTSEVPTMSAMNRTPVISVPDGCVTTQFFPFIPWDNEDNLVPKAVDNLISLVFTGVLVPLLFVVSFCTNIVNMLVFYKHGLQERINACLFTLSLVDLLSISVTFAYCADVVYMFIRGRGGEVGPSAYFILRHRLTGLHGLVLASQMVYSLIALERCLCVTRPLLVKSCMPTKVTVVALWIMAVSITGFCIFVIGAQYGVVCVFDPADGSLVHKNYPTDYYFRNKMMIDVMYTVVKGLFFPGLSFVCVTVCTVVCVTVCTVVCVTVCTVVCVTVCTVVCVTVCTVVCVTVCTVVTAIKLKKLTQWRQKVSSASGSVSSRDVAITRVIVGTSVLFIVCMLPSIAMGTCFLIVPDLELGGRYDNMTWLIRRFYQLSTAVSNTYNFFVYYVYGSKFRETTRRLFSCGHRGEITASSVMDK